MWLTITRLISFLLAAVTGVLIARVLGPGHYGELTAATAIVGVITSLGVSGFDQLLLDGSMDASRMQSRLVQMAAPILMAVIVAALFLPHITTATRVAVVLLGCGVLANQVSTTYLIVPQFALNFNQRAVREFIYKSIGTCLAAASAVFYGSAPAVAAASLVSGAIFIFVAFRDFKPKALLRVRGFLLDLRRSLPYALSSILFTLYVSIDTLILALERGRHEVAMYGVASGIFIASTLTAVTLNNDILRTRIYRAKGHWSGSGIRRISVRVLWLNAVLGLIGAIVLVILRRPIVTEVYGTAFEAAIPIVALLAWAIPLHYFNSWAANVLIGNGRIRTVTWIQAMLAAFNVVACLISIPQGGANAAATVTILTEAVGAVFYTLLTLRLFACSGMSDDAMAVDPRPACRPNALVRDVRSMRRQR